MGSFIKRERSKQWPTFFIVGAAKAGTTSLHNYLGQHPLVFMSAVKEPHFFSQAKSIESADYAKPRKGRYYHSRIVRSQREYLDLFTDSGDAEARGESSPSYLWDADSAVRIRNDVPDARIVIMLRDPVERAYSHYLMDVSIGNQRRPFLEAVTSDLEATKKGWGISRLYVELGQYAEQVRRFIRMFGRDKVLVVEFETFRSETKATVKRVIEFITDRESVDVDAIDWGHRHNSYSPPRNELARFLLQQNALKHALRRVLPVESVRTELKRRFLVRSTQNKPPIDEAALDFLWSFYASEIDRLEVILETPLPSLRRSQRALRKARGTASSIISSTP